jgi:hypothetical protein
MAGKPVRRHVVVSVVVGENLYRQKLQSRKVSANFSANAKIAVSRDGPIRPSFCHHRRMMWSRSIAWTIGRRRKSTRDDQRKHIDINDDIGCVAA